MKCEHDREKHTCSACEPEKVFHQYERKSALRGLKFRLTFEEFEKLVSAPCFYCGENPGMGIDRVDNRIGYIFSENPILNNVVSCCADCNFLKGSRFSRHAFLAQVTKIAAYQEKLRKQKLVVPPQAVAA
jgi:hypothetical protein